MAIQNSAQSRAKSHFLEFPDMLFRNFPFLKLNFLVLFFFLHNPGARTAADSGWTPIYKGNFDNIAIYLKGRGFLINPDNQKVFIPQPDQIHVTKSTTGLIITKDPYSYYHARVNYRWGGTKAGSQNAGFMTHVDLKSTVTSPGRPHSVELNMRRDKPGSVWLASKLGPFGSSYIGNGKAYLPRALGGQRHDFTPWGDRTWDAHYTDGRKPTNPFGEWNLYEAVVYGADSIIVIINGDTINRVYDLRIPDENNKPGQPNTEGGIGLQSEGHEIFYKNWAVRSLVGCMDPSAENYGFWYVKDSIPSLCKKVKTNGTSRALPAQITVRGLEIAVAIRASGSHAIKILDVSGSVVYSHAGTGRQLYHLKKYLKEGVYFVQLNIEGNNYTVKIILNI